MNQMKIAEAQNNSLFVAKRGYLVQITRKYGHSCHMEASHGSIHTY